MGTRIQTIIDHGMDGIFVEVECHISNGLPAIVIVGSASTVIAESKERVRNALLASGLDFPRKRITLNLAPADIPKSGSSLDLPIVVAILHSSGQLMLSGVEKYLFLGEISLDGSIRPIRGLIGKILAAQKLGDFIFVIPWANASQANSIKGVDILPVNSLRGLVDHFSGLGPIVNTDLKQSLVAKKDDPKVRLDDIVGQQQAKRALIVAAAGGHNILFSGPPGTGKSMLARALASLLPPLTTQEKLEVTHLHSLTSPNFEAMVTERPFRAPHHTSSHTAITGGGQGLRPGEISLSHHGVLFLDELPEFNRPTIEALRQPLEDRQITITRTRGSIDMPANFILVATANPCPCGYLGSEQECSCSAADIARYKRKLSGPIMDRIDLHTLVDRVDHENLLTTPSGSTETRQAQRAITAARRKQLRRNGPDKPMNALLNNVGLQAVAQLSKEAKQLLDTAAKTLRLSARGYMRCVKVARTIADLDNSDGIEAGHIAEALQYRQMEPLGL